MGRPKTVRQGDALVEDTTKMEITQEPFVADLTNLTPEELAIAKRVGNEDDGWQTIGESDMNDFSMSEDPFRLPPPAQKAENEKKYAFRWIRRDPARLDEVKRKPVPMRWWIANRTTTPFLASYVDPILGCITNHDQMLVFKPWWMHEKEKEAKRELADALDQRRVDNKAKEKGFEGGSRFSESGTKLPAEIRGTGMTMAEGEDFLEGPGRSPILTDDLIDTQPE
jgi:hypothetical protein